jgi:hypothetical protein
VGNAENNPDQLDAKYFGALVMVKIIKAAQIARKKRIR